MKNMNIQINRLLPPTPLGGRGAKITKVKHWDLEAKIKEEKH